MLEENNYAVGASTLIYDKPLVYFLLSYFILLGIKKINIVCTEKEQRYINQEFSNGATLGIDIGCSSNIPLDYYKNDSGNVMIIFGKSIIYGVDQTRFFQKAMVHKERITVLSLPKKKTGSQFRIYFDSNKKLVASEDGEQLHTQYDYYQIPVLFCPSNIIGNLSREYKTIQETIFHLMENQTIYTIVLDRGFVEIPVESWDNVLDASNFVKTIEKACGMQIYCIEEIAWRRGLISKEAFEAHANKKEGTEYGKYMRALIDPGS